MVRPGIWLSIDGVEGAGKTTLAAILRERAPDALLVAEFSDDPVGQLLQAAVQKNPHHISPSAMGQSLLFLAEFRTRFDTAIEPAIEGGALVLHDRGYLSKYGYQHAVMEPSMGADATALLDAIFSHLPPPDLTVMLTAPIATIRARLLGRDGECDDRRLDFIERAASAMERQSRRLPLVMRIDSSVEMPASIADLVMSRVNRVESAG